MIRRREFFTFLGGATAALPLVARAQQPIIIGFLHTEKQGDNAPLQPFDIAFRAALMEQGYVEGVNVNILYRFAETQYDRLPEQAADLVRRRVDVIFVSGHPAGVLAAKAATATIPIVFVVGGADPAEFGIVNGSGVNVTGVSLPTTDLTLERLELLHGIAPSVALIGWLHDPSVPRSEVLMKEVQTKARTLGVSLNIANASAPREVESAFATLVSQGVRALLVGSDPILYPYDDRLLSLAARYVLPAIYPNRRSVNAGGLMSYEPSLTEVSQFAVTYIVRILKGEKPSDLPVQQPNSFELVINRNAARSLGIEIPKLVLSRAQYLID